MDNTFVDINLDGGVKREATVVEAARLSERTLAEYRFQRTVKVCVIVVIVILVWVLWEVKGGETETELVELEPPHLVRK